MIPRPPSPRHAPTLATLLRRREGMTLIELLIVITLVVSITGLAAVSFGLIGRANIKGETRKFGGTVRYIYNQAATQNQAFQLVIDIEKREYWVDQLELSGALSRDDISGATLQAQIKAQSEERAERIDGEDTRFTGVLNRAPVEGMLIERTTLPDDVAILGVMTSHHEEIQTEGVATINFFPSGFVEQSVIFFGPASEVDDEGFAAEPDDGDVYSLFIHPLTGHTSLEPGRAEIERDFFEAEEDD